MLNKKIHQQLNYTLENFKYMSAKQKLIDWNLSDIAIFQDYKDLLKMDEVDLVEILVPHHLHIDVALEAIFRKKSISLQKPMCLNISEANKLISEAKKADVSLKIFENLLDGSEHFALIKGVIKKGVTPRVRVISSNVFQNYALNQFF